VEQAAWQALSATFAAGAAGSAPAIRVYYRWRQRRTKKKAGNVADFCRRWGRDYRYMVVLDADSVMSGEAILSMLRVMEARPRVGILQTAPRACGHDSLHARVQQFAGRVTGALFSAGLRYWQLGESHYWGHNAILRVEPFMRHCALAPLPGTGGLSGAILSHDFVEAALMRRAGYEVWLAPDIEGSFEQPPPHLLDELQRDRRWCQGNLQNARLVAEPGLAPVHRAMFVTGAMSYLASPLWLAFALIGLLPWLADGTVSAEPALPLGALLLWGLTLALLFVPRVLAVRLVVLRGEQAAYGGTRKLIASAVLEALLSALLAPVRMLAHSLFVLGALTGLKLQWKSPSREATDVGWREAAARFGVSGVLAVGVCAWWLAGQPQEAWRVLPLALPLALAVPLAVLSSRRSLGLACKRQGWLLTPEESRTPAVLRQAHGHAAPPAEPLSIVVTPAHAVRPTPAGSALAWSGRGVALAGLAAGLMALALPRPVATGGLSSADLAALRIVMQAQSPSAAPRVLVQRPARMTRVSDTEPRRPRRVTSI
ncbi:MAG TPA: glucans biosynthesis glucosyltransferase MdoH, partial [Methylibium sp.]|nr:glucans biosynthesis glucosyltransferase MdoH [Methylibium sp.]